MALLKEIPAAATGYGAPSPHDRYGTTSKDQEPSLSLTFLTFLRFPLASFSYFPCDATHFCPIAWYQVLKIGFLINRITAKHRHTRRELYNTHMKSNGNWDSIAGVKKAISCLSYLFCHTEQVNQGDISALWPSVSAKAIAKFCWGIHILHYVGLALLNLPVWMMAGCSNVPSQRGISC